MRGEIKTSSVLRLAEKAANIEYGNVGAGAYLLYDGDCPVCKTYCGLLKFQERFGKLYLLNVRGNEEMLNTLNRSGIDIDEGFVLLWRDHLYFSSDAFTLLNQCTEKKGFFGLIVRCLQSNATNSIVYPVLALCRKILLSILGIRRINEG